MNSRIFTRCTGTPTLRAALASPPTAKIQFPKRVRARTQVASSVMRDPPDHADAEVVRRPEGAGEQVSPRCRRPATAFRPATRTVPVIAFVKPRLTPWRMKKVASVTMKLGNFVFMTM